MLPLSFIYYIIVLLKYICSKPKAVGIPVICVGNVVLGGTGKTPTVIAIANFFKQRGKKVAIISRGYKGSLSFAREATLVGDHTTIQVGDEALMLSKVAPTYINRNRFLSANRAKNDGAEIIIMDDGLQNYTLKKDFSVLLIDSNYGLGNGLLLPAGPMRETLKMAFSKSGCIIYTGGSSVKVDSPLPRFYVEMRIKNAEQLRNKTFIALCSIASPDKFFTTLKELNIKVAEQFTFGDHHNYSEQELEIIVNLANKLGQKIITTTKDIVKIPTSYQNHFEVVDIEYILPNEFWDYCKLRVELTTKY